MTPNELAAELGISPKTLRKWLRQTYHRSEVERYQRWSLNSSHIQAARTRFKPKR